MTITANDYLTATRQARGREAAFWIGAAVSVALNVAYFGAVVALFELTGK